MTYNVIHYIFVMVKEMNKDTTIVIRIEKRMKKELQTMAENDRRSLADFIRLKLESIVAESKKK